MRSGCLASAIAFSTAWTVAASTVPVGSTPSSVWNAFSASVSARRPVAVHRAVPEAGELEGLLDGRVAASACGGDGTALGPARACSAAAGGLVDRAVTGNPLPSAEPRRPRPSRVRTRRRPRRRSSRRRPAPSAAPRCTRARPPRPAAAPRSRQPASANSRSQAISSANAAALNCCDAWTSGVCSVTRPVLRRSPPLPARLRSTLAVGARAASAAWWAKRWASGEPSDLAWASQRRLSVRELLLCRRQVLVGFNCRLGRGQASSRGAARSAPGVLHVARRSARWR